MKGDLEKESDLYSYSLKLFIGLLYLIGLSKALTILFFEFRRLISYKEDVVLKKIFKIITSMLLMSLLMVGTLGQIASASPSQSEIEITKNNSQEMLTRALAGDQEVIDAANKLQAFQKASVQEELKKINFQDGKATHRIDFNDGSSIVMDNGPAQSEQSISKSSINPNTIITNVSITWVYDYKIFVGPVEWGRYSVFMKYYVLPDASTCSLDMANTYDNASNFVGITVTARGVSPVVSDGTYYVQTRGQAYVTGQLGTYSVTMNCYGKADYYNNWSQVTLY